MSKADGERTESIWLPASRGGHKSEACWVDQRNDSHRCTTVGQVDAANATIVFDEHAQEVLVRDALGVTSRLHTSHHELVLCRNFLLDTLLFLHSDYLVLNISKINSQLVMPFGNSCMRSLNCLVDELVTVGVAVAFSMNSHALFDVEADTVSIELAVLVVNFDGTGSDFVGQENVLVENGAHGAGALINAAPSLDLTGLLLGFSNNKIDGLLTDNHNLLVLHRIVFVMGV